MAFCSNASRVQRRFEALLPGLSCLWSTGEGREVSVFTTAVLSSQCLQQVLMHRTPDRSCCAQSFLSRILESRVHTALVTKGPIEEKVS